MNQHRIAGPWADHHESAIRAPQAIEFRCPLPPRAVSQNGPRGNPWEHNKAVQAYRRIVGAHAIEQLGAWPAKPFPRARLRLTFVVPDLRRRDARNLSGAFKSGIDALVDVGLIVDDDWQHLEDAGSPVRVVRPGEKPGVIVRLEPLPCEQQGELEDSS